MIKTNVHYPIYGEYDVIVSGGGLIGLTCATALARAGRKVALVERRSALGWEIGRARRLFAESDQAHAASGYIQELLAAMRTSPLYGAGFHAPVAELIFDRWVVEARVDVMFHGWSAGVATLDGVVDGLLVGTREGYQKLKAPLVIETDDYGRLIDAGYVKAAIPQPLTRAFLIANAALVETRELRLSAGHRLILQPLTNDQARVDVVLQPPVDRVDHHAIHDFHAVIAEAIQAIRDQIEGCTEAGVFYLTEEAWRMPTFQLQDGLLEESNKPIGRLLSAEQVSSPTIELSSRHLAVSRSRGLILAGPWLPCYLAASSDSESKAVINRFLLGEAAATYAITHPIEAIWHKISVS